jgi:putative protease
MQLVWQAVCLPLKAVVPEAADAIYVGFRNGTNACHLAVLNLDDKPLEEGCS